MDKIKEKIRNIIELMEGAKTEGEAKAATLALQRLLAKHHLSMSDVEIADGENEDEVVETERTLVTEIWQELIAGSLAKNIRCETYCNIRVRQRFYKSDERKKYIVFLGLEEDVFAVKELFNATICAARKLFRSWSKEYRASYNISKITPKQRKQWYIGFAAGIDKALEEQRKSSDEMALALTTPSIVQAYKNDLNLNKSRKNVNIDVDSTFTQGFSTGKDFGSRTKLSA